MVPTPEQLVVLTGVSATGIAKARNGSRRRRVPSPTMTDLEILLQDVAEIARRIQWRSPAVERAGLEDLDRLVGLYWIKHEGTIEKWRDRSGAAGLLAKALTVFDRLLTTILANNNVG